MNFKRVLFTAIVCVIFFLILRSYFAGNSTTLLLQEGSLPLLENREKQEQEETIKYLDPDWGFPDTVQGNKSRIVNTTHDAQMQKKIIADLTRDIDKDATKSASKSTLQISSKRQAAQVMNTIKKMIMHMDDDLRVQYFLQAAKYESKHSKPISELSASHQWDFLIKFYQQSGLTQRLPDVINIGVKKSGTNAIGFFITQHPLISHSLGNEVHYFDWNYDKDLEYYRSKMGFASKFQLSFEKTPRYFVTDSAPRNIRKDLGNATKFIICLRDPIDRMISDYRHERELGVRRDMRSKRYKKPPESSPVIEGKILESLILDKNGNINASQDAVRTSSYSVHLKNWLKYYPIESFLLINHDALNSDTFHVMEQVEQFLGLYSYFKPSMFSFDPDRGGPCIFNPNRECPAKSTPGYLPKAKLHKEVEVKLKEYFAPLILELIEITGLKYPWMQKYLS